MRDIIKAWIKEFRGLFLLFVTLPVILGSVISFVFYPEAFSLYYFLISVIAMLSLHAGTVILNDFFDFKSGTDVINTERTPYSGGSGLLPGNVLKPKQVFIAGLFCFMICTVLGIFIVLTRSPIVMVIGVIGVVLGFFYTAPPFKLAYRGFGEIARLIATPLMVLGAFFVQVPVGSGWEVIQYMEGIAVATIASLPLAFLNTGALYIFEFPDYNADIKVGKKNLVVRLGRQKASYVYVLLNILAYLSLTIGIYTGILPLMAGIVFILIPLSAASILGLMRYFDHVKRLVPYLKIASDTYVIASILMIVAFMV
ncbi:1,4-dihydroxy-2-naphthoate prenyltransferase [Methanocella sp. CWC-04]|uniref:1,4-dihydroxy-2-naphthoate prenyltransferase n=1 Tax=Methanooceanicella nereidis TaxID=2052831 RepID=A0AAP2RF10_9EURY|nr:prenyltransferase [Methanocella sp. CWC-04]MCD1296123.1 1,4-dihydroxy-2-naphthoate prenyltransferase [Methanocella sp. CWC-04]